MINKTLIKKIKDHNNRTRLNARKEQAMWQKKRRALQDAKADESLALLVGKSTEQKDAA